MPDQNAEVHIRTATAQHGHVLGEGLEPPIDAGAQRVEVHPLNDRQIAHDLVTQWWWARDDAKAAIAHDRSRNPERGRRRQHRIPGDLRVVMRMQVNNAWHQREPAGVDDLSCIGADFPDCGDAAVPHGHIGPDWLISEAIENRGAADHEIIHRHLFCSLCSTYSPRTYNPSDVHAQPAMDFADREVSIYPVKG